MPKPKDNKNPEYIKYKRFEFASGQDTIHGMTNFHVQTQEAQTFGFYADTGQGKSCLLYTSDAADE